MFKGVLARGRVGLKVEAERMGAGVRGRGLGVCTSLAG